MRAWALESAAPLEERPLHGPSDAPPEPLDRAVIFAPAWERSQARTPDARKIRVQIPDPAWPVSMRFHVSSPCRRTRHAT